MSNIKKQDEDKDNLVNEAIKNIRSDRNQAQFLLTKILEYIQQNDDRQKDVGFTAAKFLETLQRSNEQLVKLIHITQKNNNSDKLSDEDKEELFDELNEYTEEE